MKYFKYETESILPVLLFMSAFMEHFLILEATACGHCIENLQSRFPNSLLQFHKSIIQPIAMGLLLCKTG